MIEPKAAGAADEDDDDEDLFASDSEEEDPEAVAAKEKILAEYHAKKAAKPKPAAKSLVTLEVKPWGKKTHSLVSNFFCPGDEYMY